METYYNIPNSVEEIFTDIENGKNDYSIIDYSIQEMDNIQSMIYFLDLIGANDEDIDTLDGTQCYLKNKDYKYLICIDSGGLGDFHSHKFNTSIYYENENYNF